MLPLVKNKNFPGYLHLIVHCTLMMAALATLCLSVPAAARERTPLFEQPEVCKECHLEIYRQWKGSMHSRSYTDPIWKAAVKQFIAEAKREKTVKDLSFCLRCHVPAAFVSGKINRGKIDPSDIRTLALSGVYCDFCHSLQGAASTDKPEFRMVFDSENASKYPPDTKLGPLKIDNPKTGYHPTAYSERHTRSEFCGTCHDILHFENLAPIANTYTEWKNSPYNTGDPATTVTCQDCHMRQRPGIPATGSTPRPDNPGRAAEDGPHRSHVPTHYFVGGNALVSGKEHAKMAVERLQNSAELEILTHKNLIKGELCSIRIKVTNSGSGHRLPTGMTGMRQMWLEVIVADLNHKRILSSGVMEISGNLPEDTHLFQTILGDKHGKPVDNFALADRVLFDHRIPPKGYEIEEFFFVLPDMVPGNKIRVSAKLKYRSLSQKLMNKLLGNKAWEVPVITMETIEKELFLE